jgi:hypothetical protein
MFKNIGRSEWKFYKRSFDTYLSCFKQLAENIDYPLIVYAESEELKEIISNVRLNQNIILINSSSISTYLNTHIETERKIMESDEYQIKIPEKRRHNPEHFIPEYNLLNHSKIQFLVHAKKYMPGYKYYAWIDFGWVRDNKLEHIPRNIDLNKLNNKIIVNNLDFIPIYHIPADLMLSKYEIFIGGGSYIIPNDLIDVFQYLYNKKLEQWIHMGIADDDQNLMYQLWYENKDMFELIHTGIDNWWALYRDHLNKRS